MALSPLLITKFQEFFQGNNKAYGTFIIKKKEKNKTSGEAFTKIEEVKKEYYQNHLEGKTGLGIIPINQENKCKFGAIDIDDYNVDMKKLQEKVRINNLPLVTFRSKSGGAHLFLFLKTWVSAQEIRAALNFFLVIIGYKDLEVFPKQVKLIKLKIGNWINLPYFNYEKTERYALDNEGNKLDLFNAIKYIGEQSIDINELDSFIENFPYKDAPPCLQSLLIGLLVIKGERNNFLFNAGIYLRQKFSDTWQDELIEVNKKLLEPLTFDELTNSVINSLNKKEYYYLCRNEPLISYCNKVICRQRKYGIESASIPSEIIGELIKLNFPEPLWLLNVNGTNIDFDTKELMSHKIYQEKCFEVLHTWPKSLKKEAWRRIIEERLNNVKIQEAPEEASQVGLFKQLLMEFCTERATAITREQILNKRVYSEKGYHIFKGTDLLDFLKFNNFTYYSRNRVWLQFKDLGGSSGVLRISDKLKKNKIRIWKIPEFKNPKLEIESKPVDFEKFDKEPF